MVVVALMHFAVYQLLVFGQGESRAVRSPASVMRVEFIELAPRVEAEPPEARKSPAVSRPRRGQASAEGEGSDPLDASPTLPEANLPSDKSAPLALGFQATVEPSPDFGPPLPDQGATFPTNPQGPDRIRMRRQLTGKQVIEGTAQLLGFWPAGYESDPCPRVKRNITGLMTDTRPEGREALGEELRRQAIACRQ